MTVELNEEILHEAGIGNLFRPSNWSRWAYPTTGYDSLRRIRLSSASAGVSIDLPTPSPRNVTR